MTYELFKLGPAVYVPILIISLLITLAAYCAFPLIFASARKSPIANRRYRVYCYIFNFVVFILFTALNGEVANTGPYILWTLAFSAVGVKILDKRGRFAAVDEEAKDATVSPPAAEAAPLPSLDELNPAKPIIEESSVESDIYKYCPNCGFELLPNSRFCSACGNAITVNEE